MTRKARLTISYLTIIMAISIFFSIVVYNVAVGEADRGLRRQALSLRNNLYFVQPGTLEADRNAQLNTYRNHVVVRLVFVNLGMLVVGAGLSYFLARRNLEPLEQALDAQARFTSDAAHELRTPLTAMKTETEVGLRDKRLSLPDAKALLASNLEEVGKLETLTSALLRLAKNGAAPDYDSWRQLSLHKIMEEASARVEGEANKAKISINTKHLRDAKLYGDHDQLVELFVILLDNGIKYGKPETDISISSESKNAHEIIKVADKGIGIKQTELPYIFERFYRADQSRNKTLVSGFGLGLSLAKQITDAHNGTITVASEMGAGSTFTVALPQNRPATTTSA
jgi:signal transduction histidine kinase